MNRLFEREIKIRKEADKILYQKGLLKLLNKYGKTEITGSYPLKLMWKKDLDIGLVNPRLQPSDFFQLGSKIVKLLEPHNIIYRNTRIIPGKTRLINALYFGILFNEWKIDLWVIDEEWRKGADEYIQKIQKKLTNEKRKLILEIKEHYQNISDYGKIFSSKEIYKSVLNENITTINQFQKNIK